MKEFFPGTLSSFPRLFGRVGNRMLLGIHAGGGLYQWQSMDLATEQIEPMSWVDGFAQDWPATAGGVTYIATYATDHTNLYRTDGTRAGTQLLRRFEEERLEVPTGFTEFEGVTYFAAEDDTQQRAVAHGRHAGGHAARARVLAGERVRLPGQLHRHRRLPVLHRRRRAVRTRAVAHRPDHAAHADAGEDPPVTITPLPVRSETARRRTPACPRSPRPSAPATLTTRVQRLKTVAAPARWRITGSLSAGACSGRVQIVLGRRERTLKRVGAPLRKCRFTAVMSTTSKASGRWLQVRTVPSATVPAVQSKRTLVR